METFKIKYTETYSGTFNIKAESALQAADKLDQMVIDGKIDSGMLELEKTAISSVDKPKCRVSMEEIIKLAHTAALADWNEWHERLENSNSNPLIYVRESRAWDVFSELDKLIKHEAIL